MFIKIKFNCKNIFHFKGVVFDPFNLSMEITTKSTREFMARGEFSTAFIMSLRMNETNLIQEIIEQIPHKESK